MQPSITRDSLTHTTSSRHIHTFRLLSVVLTFMILFTASLSSTASAASAANSTKESLPKFIQVEGGYYYSIALRSDGSVWAWGRNLNGEMGIQETVTIYDSYPIRLFELTDIRHISTSGEGYHLATKADGTVWTWGATGDSKDGRQHSILPHQIQGIKHAVSTTATSNRGAAVLDDGTVWYWPRAKGTETAPVKPVQVKGLSEVIQIESSTNKMYAVKKDGTVWSWSDAAKPTKIQGFSDIRMISSGHSLLALNKKGKVWRVKEKGKPVAVQPKLTIKSIRAYDDYELLLTTSGEVYSYGGRTPTGKQGKVNGLPKVTAIAAGAFHSQAIAEDGNVWGWGGNMFSSIGTTKKFKDNMVYSPVPVERTADIYVNGKLINSRYPSFIQTNTVLLPAATVAAALGTKLQFNAEYGVAMPYSITYKSRTLSFGYEQDRIVYDGGFIDREKPLVGATGTTSIPYQLLEKGLGLHVTWNPKLQQIHIDDKASDK
ncbi:stalk domain-containing protein [Paenibacillus alvei]|uniref:Alpha-tubulin suppressor n=1 Tax=Paenibacillus alvei TaxID=44250 RepID=A0A383R677_PAEAL|nr:stalk domain-containing protein [Paenibacillus alvei]SYX82440.1 Alpha-tubulin suppressor [Paenibacillus alvei]